MEEELSDFDSGEFVSRSIILPSGTEVPEGWNEAIDKATGDLYFFHEDTQEVTWDPPSLEDIIGMTLGQASSIIQRNFRIKYGHYDLKIVKLIKAQYKRATDPSTGHSYFFDTSTKKVMWSLPKELYIKNEPKKPPPPVVRLPPGWFVAIDAKTKAPYYYNPSTSETKWTKPSFYTTKPEAAFAIQGLYRCKKARHKLYRQLYKYVEVVTLDGDESCYYFSNTSTNVKHKPYCLKSFDFDPDAMQNDYSEWKEILQTAIANDQEMKRGSGTSCWIEYFQEDQDRVFYFNNATGEFAYEMPEDFHDTAAKEWKPEEEKPRRYPRSRVQTIVDAALDGLAVGKKTTELILDDLKISKLSSRIWNLDCLVTVSCQNNNISRLPSGIQDLEALTTLDISHNKIKTLPACMQAMTWLRELDVSYNVISSFSPKLFKMHLESFDLSHNVLAKLPSMSGDLEMLKETGEWLISIGLMTESLTSLSLSHNQFKKWPVGVELCKKLETLSLSHNHIAALHQDIHNLKQLKVLQVQVNDLKGIPSSIGDECHSLELINLSENMIEELPDTIVKLNSLTECYLHGNALTDLPTFPTSVETLTIHDNKSLGTVTTVFNGTPLLKTCSLQHSNVTSIVVDKSKELSINDLNASYNALKSFPNVDSFVSLVNLNIAYNSLEALPSSFKSLCMLETLEAQGNSISSLSTDTEFYSNLAKLRNLNLSFNKLKDLPSEFLSLPALADLNLSHNEIKILPVHFGTELSSALVVLDLSHNFLNELPTSVASLSILRSIDLSSNAFVIPPIAVDLLQQQRRNSGSCITHVNLNNNPLESLQKNETRSSSEDSENVNTADQEALAAALDAPTKVVAHRHFAALCTKYKEAKTNVSAILGSTAHFPKIAAQAYFLHGVTSLDLATEALQVMKDSFITRDDAVRELYSYRALLKTNNTDYLTSAQVRKFKKQIQSTRSRKQAVENKIQTWLSDAVEDFTIAIRFNYEVFTSHLSRSKAAMLSGVHLPLALDDMNWILKSCPSSAEMRMRRADVYEKLGQMELAIADVNVAISCDPFHKPYAEKLATLVNRRDCFYSPIKELDNPATERAMPHISEDGETRTFKPNNFEINVRRMLQEASDAREQYNVTLAKEATDRRLFQKSIVDLRFEIKCRFDLEAQEEETRRLYKIFDAEEAVRAAENAKILEELKAMATEEALMKKYVSQSLVLALEAERQNQLKERIESRKETLRVKKSRRGGKRG